MLSQNDAIADNHASPPPALASTAPPIESRNPIGHPASWNSIVLAGLLAMAAMSTYELLKQFVIPEITIWQSHIMTILIATAVAMLCVYRLVVRNIKVEREIHGTVENAFDAVITLDQFGRVKTWNPRAIVMFGWPRESALRKSFIDLVTPLALRPHYEEVLRQFHLTHETSILNTFIESPALHRDGHEFPAEWAASISHLGGDYGFTVMVRDVSERKRMEQDIIDTRERALAASRAKSEFLSTMSHEIRTPMNAILGMAELLAETVLSSDQRHYLEIMSANGNALLDLINSILDLARIESGRIQLEKTEFDLTDLIDKTISTFGVSAHGKGLELAARIAPGVPDRLLGDPLRLRQVLVNLLGNAIKFTELGQVVLEVDHAPGHEPGALLFTVADTGIGVPPDKLQDIFANFTQVDSSTTRKHGGSGLGLAIAQRLVSMMGGEISLQSTVNQGSKFSFTAPFGLAHRIISPSTQVVRSLVGHRVLVVDDNQINRLILREMMSSCGAEIDEAESGEQALAAVQQACADAKPFRIVLLDMRMPGMDGLEVARRIHQDHLPVEPLILMLSSDDLKPQVQRLRELALDAYVVKPITRKELFEAIYRLLDDSNRDGARPMPLCRPVHKPEPAADAGLPQRRVLVAEDSPDNRMVISAFLRGQPFQIDFADNGQVAVDLFRTNLYDLVLMDLQMPVLDGLAATRLIRQWETEHGRQRTPVIALTASVLEDDVRKAEAAGCDSHLGKPVKKQTLIDAVRNAAPMPHALEPTSANAAEPNATDATGAAPATPTDAAPDGARSNGPDPANPATPHPPPLC
jgi:PAS domain S-box-containing protein